LDGSRHKNGSGMGAVIISPDGIPAEFKYIIEGVCTNNEAEYESLITGLELLLELGARNVKIMGDSELVIKQVSKEY
ncbi:reverse transcriptase-like protein, partial [Lactobacillus delbrueckii]|uniref:reverse transcriptase-like protein n=1 Tax=Lactobacillus delbrueckii TaxID=1584 RepID=UPI0030EA6582